MKRKRRQNLSKAKKIKLKDEAEDACPICLDDDDNSCIHNLNLRKAKKINKVKVEAEDVCPICLDVLADDDICTPNTCKHNFCYKCLIQWANLNDTCPVCRTTMEKIKFKNLDTLMSDVIEYCLMRNSSTNSVPRSLVFESEYEINNV